MNELFGEAVRARRSPVPGGQERRQGDGGGEAENGGSVNWASAGIEGLISSMERTTVEWQFPVPWWVSRAVGMTCKGS